MMCIEGALSLYLLIGALVLCFAMQDFEKDLKQEEKMTTWMKVFTVLTWPICLAILMDR